LAAFFSLLSDWPARMQKIIHVIPECGKQDQKASSGDVVSSFMLPCSFVWKPVKMSSKLANQDPALCVHT